MKKRFVTTLLALVAAIACLIGLVACGTDSVAGETYEFEKVEITKGLEGDFKTAMEEQLNGSLGECYIKFSEDGTFEMDFIGGSATGTYKQDGSKLTMTAENQVLTAKISGNKVSIEQEQQGMGVKVTFKLVAPEKPGETTGTITSP